MKTILTIIAALMFAASVQAAGHGGASRASAPAARASVMHFAPAALPAVKVERNPKARVRLPIAKKAHV
jgi:hypothetical protein